MQHLTFPVQPALVTRRVLDRVETYLQLAADGGYDWTGDPAAATIFPSMREAARMALKLPAGFRAFGMPRDVELDIALN